MTTTAADIADRLGLKRHPRSWRGDCPGCSYPRVFAVREERDQRPRLFCANGCNHDALNDAMQRVMGGSWTPPERPDQQDEAKSRERKQAAALKLWNGSEPAAGTIADRYLTSRHLPELAASPVLRFRGDCHHPEGGRYPAMVALVTDATGSPLAVHRTYLRRDGTGKAGAMPDKASLGPIWTGAVRLDSVAPELVIGEGLESAASASRMLGLPAWAALSAGNLAIGLVLPPEVRSVTIAADNDQIARNGHRPGQEAADAAARRWRREGRRVRIALPDRCGYDFNDLLIAREHRDA